MNRLIVLQFYILCILYKLGLKKLATNLAKFVLVSFKNVDENAFIKTSKLNKSYIQNDPHFNEKELLDSSKDSNFSVRDMPLFFFSFKQLRIRNQLNIVDIGGAQGSHFFSLTNEIDNEIIKNYYIFEIPYFVNFHNRNNLSPKIKCNNIDNLKEFHNERIDIIHITGTLQYLHNYREIIDIAKKIQPEYILFVRTPVWNKKTTSVIQHMGGGSNATNAAYIFNEQELDVLLEDKFSKIETNFGSFDRPFVIPEGRYPYKSLCYKSK